MNRKNNICVYGLGYVGLPLLCLLAENKIKVVGVDVNSQIVNNLKNGRLTFYEKGLQTYYNKIYYKKNFSITKKLTSEQHQNTNVYIICVGTPLINLRKTDNKALIRVSKEISKHINDDDLVILRSTVNIGTTRRLILPILNKSKKNFNLSYCPERTLEGDSINELRINPQIISSNSLSGLNKTNNIFKIFLKTIINVSSFETAELIKLMDNLYRSYNFAFANQIALLCDKININVNEVISSANKFYKRTNIAKPGPVGGPCLSKDPYIFANSLTKFRLSNEFILLSRKTNDLVVEEISKYILSFLNSKNNNDFKFKISFLGLAFKGYPVTDDIRDSSTLDIFANIKKKYKKSVYYCYDPIVSSKIIRNNIFKYCNNINEAFRNSDVVIISNNNFDFRNLDLPYLSNLMKKKSLIYDVWNLYKDISMNNIINCSIKSFGNKKLIH